MKDAKSKAAEALFAAVGEIDDGLIAECQSPAFRSEKSSGYRLLAAACAALALAAAVFAAVRFSAPPRQSGDLTALLTAAESSALTLSADELEYGSAAVVWQHEGESLYHVLPIRGEEGKRALNEQLKEHGEELPAGTVTELRVWVCLGDGSVVSPYLKESAGNVGYGELFGYSAEVLPSDGFAAFVGGLPPA